MLTLSRDAARMGMELQFDTAKSDRARLAQIREMALGLSRMMELALILARSGRKIDLAGLDRSIGPLCAQALDLPPELGRELVPVLQQQIAALDQITELIKSQRS